MRSSMVNQHLDLDRRCRAATCCAAVSAAAAVGIEALCRDLLSTRGEASGTALARELVEAYRGLPDAERLAFFELPGARFGSRPRHGIAAAAEAYATEPALTTLTGAAPRRPNRRGSGAVPAHEHGARAAPARSSGCATQLLRAGRPPRAAPRSTPTCITLLTSWFNPGFLSWPGSTGTARPRCSRSSSLRARPPDAQASRTCGAGSPPTAAASPSSTRPCRTSR